MTLLHNSDIADLDQAASGGPASLKAYLDEKSGYADAVANDYHEELKNTHVLLTPNQAFRGNLNSQSMETLVQVIQAGDVLERLEASIRLLSLPPIFLKEGDVEGSMCLAQKTLSETLVAHPALLHPRVFMRATHFAKSESGPVAFVMAGVKRIEFPRVAHGIPVERIRVFAKHHCVRSGLTGVSPSPRRSGGEDFYMHGKTMLQSLRSFLLLPRRAMLLSLLELDEHRAHGVKRRPASLLSTQDKTVTEGLRQMVANTLTSAYDLYDGRAYTGFDATDLVRLLKSSGMSDSYWFMQEVESALCRAHAAADDKLAPGLQALGKALLQLQPKHWVGPEPITTGVPITDRMVSRWMTVALLDASPERAEEIEKRHKSLGKLSPERKLLTLAAIDSVHPEHWDAVSKLVEGIFEQRLDDEGQGWRTVRMAYTMRRSIDMATSLREGAKPTLVQPEASPHVQAGSVLESGHTQGHTNSPESMAPARRSRAL